SRSILRKKGSGVVIPCEDCFADEMRSQIPDEDAAPARTGAAFHPRKEPLTIEVRAGALRRHARFSSHWT
ncbi:MAG: hypothetical protein J6I40_07470, partial [Mailhella sp.]|nr:hypothetical protein [Mailhella sp.]